MTSRIDSSLISRFMSTARRRAGWFRFFVPLDGMSVALELKLEASGQISEFRVSGQQSESLEEKPRLKAMLIEAAQNRLALVNLMLDEMEMPWEVLRTFRNSAGAAGAIIEAADNRLQDIIKEGRDANNDCA